MKIRILILMMCVMISLNYGGVKYAGWRASRVMPGQFPGPDYWSKVSHVIADKFENTEPAGVWIVSTYWGNGLCRLHFPHPGNGKSYENISFDSRDLNEPYLDLFDSTGVKVWLQVESGDAKMDTLISLVMDRYKHHQCVLGFGVDNEWYFNSAANDYWGREVTDEEAERWEIAIKTYDSTYTLTMKHWSTKNMPPQYRGDIIFISDSQDFNSMNAMVNEFKYWGDFYKSNLVIYQFGYDSDVDSDGDNDKDWWGGFVDPVKTIGDELFTKIDNCLGIYWVDFTIKDVFPVDNILTKVDGKENVTVTDFQLKQNYPNPFNSNTVIEFKIPNNSFTQLVVYDIQGRRIKSLVNEILPAGHYKFNLILNGLSSGIYYYQLIHNNHSEARCMLFLK